MLSDRKLFIVLIALMVIVIVLLAGEYNELRKDGTKCLINPMVYGVQKISERNKVNLSCTCFFHEPNSPTIFVTPENLTMRR